MLTASGLEQLFQQLGDQHYGKGLPWHSPFWQLGQSWHRSCYCGSLLSKVSSCRVNLPATRAAGFQTSLQGSDLIRLHSEGVLVARWQQTIAFGINLCWTKLSAGPAPPGRAMTHVLVKTRRQQQPLTVFLKHTCVQSILKSGRERQGEQLDDMLEKETFHAQVWP